MHSFISVNVLQKKFLFPHEFLVCCHGFSLGHMNCLSPESRDARQAGPSPPPAPRRRKVITLSRRGGGRQGSDGGCRQAKVYMYVGETGERQAGMRWDSRSGSRSHGGGRGSVGSGNQSRVSHRLLLNIPPCEIIMIHSGVKLYRAHSFNTYQMFQHTYCLQAVVFIAQG